jgi:hypothetical protein
MRVGVRLPGMSEASFEPGEVSDLAHGLPGPAEEHPGEEPDEPTRINDEDGA